jgi:hypothetical protein
MLLAITMIVPPSPYVTVQRASRVSPVGGESIINMFYRERLRQPGEFEQLNLKLSERCLLPRRT